MTVGAGPLILGMTAGRLRLRVDAFPYRTLAGWLLAQQRKGTDAGRRRSHHRDP